MFRSFFIAGFEGATGYNRHGQWFDQVVATAHDCEVETDYRLIAEAGLLAARECVRWPLVDCGNQRYDFASVQPMVDAARRNGVEVIWDLFHFGYPAGVDPLSPQFGERFAAYCDAFARFVAPQTEGTLWITPVNEPSYFAFAAGEQKLFAPHLEGMGGAVKRALVGAAIAGIDAIRSRAPGARFLNADPLCRVVPRQGCAQLASAAEHFNARAVFEAWDMLAGRLCPELGGSPAHLDVVGINYYWTNQWELEGVAGEDGVVQPLARDDPRRTPLSYLVADVIERYGAEVVISETSHYGALRAAWIRELGREVETLKRRGYQVGGLCLYPILGMTDWHEPTRFIPMGLWDCAPDQGGGARRKVNGHMFDELQNLIRRSAAPPPPISSRSGHLSRRDGGRAAERG